MLAVENGLTHLNVAKAMLKRDSTLVSLTLESDGLWQVEYTSHD